MKDSSPRTISKDADVDNLFADIRTLFDVTERVIASHAVTADQLNQYATNLAMIRSLLQKMSGRRLDGGGSPDSRLLAEQCRDLEGRVKELRNDLSRP